MRRASAFVVLLATATLAGCIAAAPEAVVPATLPTADDLGLAALLTVDHDHADAALHTALSPNVRSAGFSDLAFDGVASDSNTALDAAAGIAVLGLAGTTSGMAVVDVSDPANPVTLSRFLVPNTYGSDVKITPDGKTAFLATQWTDPTSPANLPKYDVIALTEDPMAWGVFVVDLTDPTAPELESFLPVYRGAHTVHYHVIDGEEYVFMCTYQFLNVAVGSKENPVATKVVIGKLSDVGGRRVIQPVSEYTRNLDPATIAGANGRVFPHELTVSTSPVDGKTYAWVSYWDEGLVVLDVSDPTMPTVAGQWKGFEAGDGAIHYAATFPQLIHGTQVTIVGPEWFAHETSGHWWALDTTDLSDIRTLGFWTLPGAPTIEKDYLFSPHNFDLYGTWVIGANYHGGVWIWDIERLVAHFGREGDGMAEPQTPSSFRLPFDTLLHGESVMEGHADLVDVVGYYDLAHTPRSSFFGGHAPLIWLVELRDGHLLMSDMDTGLVTARLEDVPLDARGVELTGHIGH